MSIWSGTGDLIDQWLVIEPKGQAPFHRHRSAAIELTRRVVPLGGATAFLEAFYTKMDENCRAARATGYFRPSRQNWRWKRHVGLSARNQSQEVRLEQAIVAACGDDWSNQMPVASGLISAFADKRAAIDLVQRTGSTSFSFFELKVVSDNPLYAAMEILRYGLMLAWSKDNHEQLGYDIESQPVLAATNVTLSVLAPPRYYEAFDLSQLEAVLNVGLSDFSSGRGIVFDFEFSRFSAPIDANMEGRDIQSAVLARSSVWPA